jgi:hypothetical protein
MAHLLSCLYYNVYRNACFVKPGEYLNFVPADFEVPACGLFTVAVFSSDATSAVVAGWEFFFPAFYMVCLAPILLYTSGLFYDSLFAVGHTFLCLPKEKYAKEKAPRRFASACGGYPRRAHSQGVVMNSHNRALRQHNDRILDNAPGSAAKQWGF